MSINRSVMLLESDIDQENKLMYVHQKNGNYADAEKSRLKIEQLHKDLEVRTLYQMDHRHKQENTDLRKSNQNQMNAFNNFWNEKANAIEAEGIKLQGEMNLRHKNQQHNTRADLEEHLSLKVKETSELLNLRKCEEHMVKQKNFAEAHKVQQQIFNLQKSQKQEWINKRNEKIATALNTLRVKQSVELTNLRKRIKTELDELNRQRKIEEQRLQQKHQNFLKDLISQQQKEVLNFKGEFKSKGGRDSPLRTRSSFTS